jgi:carbamoyl-phosphate synthase large subunit
MRAGETDKSELVDIPLLQELGEKIGELVKHIGNLDCDVFYDGKTAAILEMNPRFGGGYPFSHTFGASYPSMILRWCGETSVVGTESVRRVGEIACKHDNIVVVDK